MGRYNQHMIKKNHFQIDSGKQDLSAFSIPMNIHMIFVKWLDFRLVEIYWKMFGKNRDNMPFQLQECFQKKMTTCLNGS